MRILGRTDAEEARDYVPAAINHPARPSFHEDRQQRQQGAGLTPRGSQAELRRLYEQDRLTPAEIGERLGMSGRTIRVWLHQAGAVDLSRLPE
jgi:hypothetical protein